MVRFKKIVGKLCYLSPLTPDDAPLYTGWLNDLEVGINLATVMVMTEDSEREWVEGASKSGEHVFGIIDNETDMLIGNCGLMNVDPVNRTAEFGIFIGDKRYWGRGFGTEATRLILDYGFNILNLNNIKLNVYSYNERAAHVYRKVGFKEIGRRRESKLVNGTFYDEIMMDILADEFESVTVKRTFEGE